MRKLILCLLLAIVIGCSAAVDIRSLDNSSSEKNSDSAFGDGTNSEDGKTSSIEKLINGKCQSCHKPIDPNKYDDEKLRRVIAEHRKRAHLSPEEITQVADYLIDNKLSPKSD